MFKAPFNLKRAILTSAVAFTLVASGSTFSYAATAAGTAVEKNDKASIDYSNVKDGYIMVDYTASTSKKLKVKIKGPSQEYVYNIQPGKWYTFSLTDGNGEYAVSVFENVSDSKYAGVLSKSIKAEIKDEFAPFLCSNQFVDYENAAQTKAQAAKITTGVNKELEKVAAVYDYVVNNISYDKSKVETVESGYLPVLDSVLKNGKGICFDYAAVMTAMLRLQGIPCKLVVGNSGKTYHAWIDVWTKESGWVNQVIKFNGSKWERMDPTFASSGKQSAAVMKYIGDGSNYSARFYY